MKCLIPAAGRGRRTAKFGKPKPLIPVLGLPLIERTIASAADAGVAEFYVVTGCDALRIEAFLSELSARRGLSIVTIRNDDWRLGNGSSVLAARDALAEDFLLVMADDVFDDAIVHRLLAHAPPRRGIAIAADSRLDGSVVGDPADATKLDVRDGRVVAIGKDLHDYDAFDTGMFFCSPSVFPALEKSIQQGDGSFAGGVRVLAEEGNVRVVDVDDLGWVDVDTPASLTAANRLLRRSLRKPDDGVIARYVNRPISSGFLTPMLLRLFPGVTPNQVSLLGLVVAVAAALMFGLRMPVLGAIGVMLASLLDGSDGEVARLKRVASPLGTFVDAVLDRYADAFMLAGAAYYAFRAGSESAWFGANWNALVALVAVLAVAGDLMVSYTSAKAVVDLGHRYRGRWIAAGRGRDLRLFVLFLGGVFASVDPVSVVASLAVIATVANVQVAARLWTSWRIGQRGGIAPEVHAIVFDLDGTIADTMPFLTDLATEVLTQAGMAQHEARRRYHETAGRDFASQLEELFPDRAENERDAAEFEAAKREGFLQRPVFDDARPALAFLRDRSVRRFLCSSTVPELVTEYLKHADLDAWFDDWTGFEPGFDKGEQVVSLLRRHGLDADDLLYVGDTPRDHELVASKGVHFVGLERSFPRPEFRRRGLRSVADLRQLVRWWRHSEWLRRQVEVAG